MFGSCVTRNPENSGGAEVERDGVGAVTPLLPRRLSWWDLNFASPRPDGVCQRTW